MIHAKRYSIPSGRAVYVDATNGSDTGNGSASTPLKTIAAANAIKLKPRDKVMLKCGETWSGTQFSIPSHGKPHAPIFVSSYGAGEQPIIDVATAATGALTCDTNHARVSNLCLKSGSDRTVKIGASGVILDNCTVVGDNSTRADGIRVYGDSSIVGIVVSNCTVYNCKILATGGGGIGVQPVDTTSPGYVTIEGCTVYACGTNTSGDHGIYVKFTAYATVRNNICHDNAAGGMKITTSTPTVNIYGNRCYNNKVGIFLDTFSNGRVFNNVCYMNADAGVWILSGSSNGYVYNNTLVNNSGGCIRIEVSGITGFQIKNNLLFNDYNTAGVGDGSEVVRIYNDADASNNTFDYNLGYYANHSGEATIMFRRTNTMSKMTFAQWQALGADAHGVSAAPVFVTAYSDLHLQTTSPAKAAGATNLGILTDYDGVVRGAAIDIGAFEYV